MTEIQKAIARSLSLNAAFLVFLYAAIVEKINFAENVVTFFIIFGGIFFGIIACILTASIKYLEERNSISGEGIEKIKIAIDLHNIPAFKMYSTIFQFGVLFTIIGMGWFWCSIFYLISMFSSEIILIIFRNYYKFWEEENGNT